MNQKLMEERATHQGQQPVYEWGSFRLFPKDRRLFLSGKRVNLSPQLFDTLLMLVESAPQLVRDEDLRTHLWADTSVSEGSLSNTIYELRKKVFRRDQDYIEREPRIGYRFNATVTMIWEDKPRPALVMPPLVKESSEGQQQNNRSPDNESGSEDRDRGAGLIADVRAPADQESDFQPAIKSSSETGQDDSKPTAYKVPWFKRMRTVFVSAAILAGMMLAWLIRPLGVPAEFRVGAQTNKEIYSPGDEAEIRRVLWESQSFETLTVYGNPKAFDRSQLMQYWVPAEKGGRAILSLESAVQKELARKQHYGEESKAELFEILHVSIHNPGDYAEARTREKWYVPVYREDGTRIVERNPFLGPYLLDYTLRKLDGKWLVQASTTPYAQ